MSARTVRVKSGSPHLCQHGDGLPQGPTCHRVELMATLARWVPLAVEGKVIVSVLGGPRAAARRACGIAPGERLPVRLSAEGRLFMAWDVRLARWVKCPIIAASPRETRMPGGASVCQLVGLLTPAERAVYAAKLEAWTL